MLLNSATNNLLGPTSLRSYFLAVYTVQSLVCEYNLNAYGVVGRQYAFCCPFGPILWN